ncbi:TasA family protein [Halorussus marinus]|uniref:TasA family protein n=1 Tax=Halorussus marinus TaxID=2505976 RepID=UPI00106E29EB|nr:TasA family protein [Halorussus marinus]
MSDDKSRFELTRRRLLGGLATTGVAAGGAGAGTWAYFSDTESSDGNSVQAGTMNLDLQNGGSTVRYSFTGAAPGGKAKSGAYSSGFFAQLHNTGSVDGDHVEIDFRNTELEDGDGDPSTDETVVGDGGAPESDPVDGAEGMAEYVYVEKLAYIEEYDSGGSPVSMITLVNDGEAKASPGDDHYIQDTNGNSFIDLADLAASANDDALDGFAPPPAGGTPTNSADEDNTGMRIEVSLHESTPNQYQGDIVQTEVAFSLHQGSNQNS